MWNCKGFRWMFCGAVLVLQAVEVKPNGKYDDLCLTPECIASAHSILQNLDPSVNPCDDFYRYACGGFLKRVRIPDDKQSETQFSLTGEELGKQLRDILEAESTDKESKVIRQARDLYKACMDLDKIEELGLKPLRDLLKQFGGGWPVLEEDWSECSFEWHELVYKLRENGYSTDYIVDISISADLKNSSYRTIYLGQASLGLSREYLIQGLENRKVQYYYDYMQKVAVLLGADPEKAKKELKESLLFEIRLANASLPRAEMRNASKMYNPFKLNELKNLAPAIPDWTSYVNNILTKEIMEVGGDERVIVITPGFFRNLTEILKKEPKRNIANYMFWRAAGSSVGYLNRAAREVSEEYTKSITGKTEIPPRWKTCTSNAAGSFSAAVGKLYVLNHFQEDAKEAMDGMVKGIKAEFEAVLNDVDWMDEKTKSRAHKKLSTIRDYVGYPDEILVNANLEELYDGLEISADQYLKNEISVSIWSTNDRWRKLRDKIDKADWQNDNPAVVNAFYNLFENAIKFPAGILQGVFFGKDRPNYMNYGSIGWIVGHEITHGFDDQGRQFNDVGDLADWWEPKTKEKFLQKSKCIIDQYGNYTAEQVNMSLNGINTQGENIADNGGIKEAYRAYQGWVNRNGEEKRLPVLNLNQRQLFWLSAANTRCSKYRSKALESTIMLGAHPPGEFRVRGAFSNSKEFAKDFQCAPGAPMNPVEKCEVW